MKHLLKTSDLTPAQFAYLLDLAAEFKEHPLAQHDLLKGQTVVLYFAKPSTRTRISFETAVARLGGIPSTVGTADLQIGRGETFEDTAKVVSRYSAAFVIRTFADDDVRLISEAATIPVINALTDDHHPCQSLADLLTMREKWGALPGHKVAWVGAGNNVLHSLMEACALCGVDMSIATPVGYEPNPDIVAGAMAIAAETGAMIELTNDPRHAVMYADAIYTDAWISMGDHESQRAARIAALTPFRVTNSLMDYTNPGGIFMHCLPAHRGEEVTAEVIDGPDSVVFDQAENRLHTAQAILYALISGKLEAEATMTAPKATQVALPVLV
ncbi:MAG: ornithine carbamoyltransferase [Chloroflexi bacterium]|nr:MAG: ornithine carbamoyltransferase [Chloroflexota bacterium]